MQDLFYNKKEYVIALMDDDVNNPESAELRTKVIKQREREEKRKKEARSKAEKKAAYAVAISPTIGK